jgi:hypothetical protein
VLIVDMWPSSLYLHLEKQRPVSLLASEAVAKLPIQKITFFFSKFKMIYSVSEFIAQCLIHTYNTNKCTYKIMVRITLIVSNLSLDISVIRGPSPGLTS